jgi:fibronectin type 3 domain-containing protein
LMQIKPPLKLDLRIGDATPAPFRDGEWAAHAQLVPPGPVEKGIATYEIPSAQWTGKDVTIAVRAVGGNGKESTWSAIEALPVVAPPQKPAAPKLESTAEGVRLTWEGAAGDYRIYRRQGEEKAFARVGDVQRTEWTDRTSEFGTPYVYMVQRIVKLGANREAESDPSEELPITPKDTFQPAAPTGLRASPAAASVELSWERNAEPDLAGYRIYRAIPGGAFEKIAEVSQVPSYSDRTVEHARQYRYTVTAFDKSGNESPQSAIAEVSLQ